ncbi:hypothetical protein WISP_01181 [Willisornis vidua]|uniref:MHC class I-like antigen recognition-like domain-containing protein n=1 Tax=Willisornis vidua TaxID=1566151 RepID=A0ABQ9DUR4_9PASS|nr:hypothetical protein WISP_01181 [Willisornis vidua]
MRYQYVMVSEPSPGVPQFMSVAFLDGIPFVRYDSERGRAEPQTPWMEKGVEPGYWDERTQVYEKSRHVAATALEIGRGLYNQSGGD